jgi:hypothetical protein
MEPNTSGGCWDAGLLEISTNGGSTFTQIAGSAMLTDPYNGAIGANNPAVGLQGWCGDPQAYLRSVVDLTSLAAVEFRFGGEGTPASGSIQIADVRFQEKAVSEPLILSDGVAPNQGAGYGPPATGPDPAALLAGYDVTAGNLKLIDTVGTVGGNTTWTVDDDRAQCPNANFNATITMANAPRPIAVQWVLEVTLSLRIRTIT